MDNKGKLTRTRVAGDILALTQRVHGRLRSQDLSPSVMASRNRSAPASNSRACHPEQFWKSHFVSRLVNSCQQEKKIFILLNGIIKQLFYKSDDDILLSYGTEAHLKRAVELEQAKQYSFEFHPIGYNMEEYDCQIISRKYLSQP